MGKFSLGFIFLFMVGCIASNEQTSSRNRVTYTGACTEVPIFEDGRINVDGINTSAGFSVGEVEVTITEEASTDMLPSKFTVEFKARASDNLAANRSPLQTVQFKVLTYQEASEGEASLHAVPGNISQKQYVLQEVSSDNEGYIKWQETYDYLTPGDNRWIYFERVITTANEGGQVVIPIIINPWIDNEKKGYDIRYREMLPDNIYTMPNEDQDSKPLLANEDFKNCVERRSLTHIFRHLETKPKPLLYAGSMGINANFSIFTSNNLEGFQSCSCDGDQECIQKIKYEDKDRGFFSNYENPCEEKGLLLEATLTIPLKVKLLDSVGDVTEKEPKKKGEFKITPIFVAVLEDGSRYPLHTSANSQTEDLDSEGLTSRFKIHVPYRSSNIQYIQLWLKVSDIEEKFKPLVGVYEFIASDVFDLKNENKFVWVTESQEFIREGITNDLDKFYESSNLKSYLGGYSSPESLEQLHGRFYSELEAIISPNGSLQTLRVHPSAFGTSIPSLAFQRMRYNKVSSLYCESVVKRAVEYIGTVNVTDPVSQGSMANKKVNIKVEEYILAEEVIKRRDRVSEEERNNFVSEADLKIPLLCKAHSSSQYKYVDPNREVCEQTALGGDYKTQINGDLTIDYKLEHYVYDTQNFFPRKFVFEIDGYAVVNKFFAFNPWEYGFLTYQDYTDFYEKYVENGNSTLISKLTQINQPPELRMSDYRSFLIEPSYNVENSLDINISKNFMFSFRPFVIRKDSIGSSIRSVPRPLPIGEYILRVILLKGPQERDDGVSIVEPSEQVKVAERFRDLSNEWAEFSKKIYVAKEKVDAIDSEDEILGIASNLNELLGDRLTNIDAEISNAFDEVVSYGSPDRWANLEAFRSAQSDCNSNNQNCLPPFEKEDYISHYDTIVYSDNGVVNAFVNLELGTRDFRFIGSKVGVVFQLLPVDPAFLKYNEAGGQCKINLNESKFKPFYDHDLIVQPHWGLISLSDFGHSYPVRPLDEKLLENLVGEGKPMTPLSHSSNLEPVLEQFQSTISTVSKESDQLDESYINKKFAEVKNKIQDLNSYCEVIEDDGSEDQFMQECLCYASEEEREISDEDIQNCVVRSSFEYMVDKPLNEAIDKVKLAVKYKSPRDEFCSEEDYAESYYSDGEDVSANEDRFKNCVCHSDREGENLTDSMSECFAKGQGLQMISSSDLAGELKNLTDDLFESSLVLPYETYEHARQQMWNRSMRYYPAPAAGFLIRSDATEEKFEQEKEEYQEDKLYYADYNAFNLLSEKNYSRKLELPFSERFKLDNKARVLKDSARNMEAQAIDQIIREGFNYTNNELINESQKTEPQGYKGEFLHLMCTFWFNNYYNKFFDPEQIKEMYKNYQRNDQILRAQGVLSEVVETILNFDEGNHKEKLDRFFLDNKDKLQEAGVLVVEDLFRSEILQDLEELFKYDEWILERLNRVKSFKDHLDGVDLASLKGIQPFSKDSNLYRSCLSNPLYFFHFERNIMVSDLSSNTDDFNYKNGYTYSVSVRESKEAGVRKAWGTRLSIQNSSDLKISKSFFGVGLDYRMGTARGLTKDDGEAQSGTEGENKFVSLAVNHIKTEIGLDTYKECMIVRPKSYVFKDYKFNSEFTDQLDELLKDQPLKEKLKEFIQFAYSGSGIFVCSDEKTEALQVEEDYYYLHQFFGGHSEFLSRTIFQNRPFTELIRGKANFNKFLTVTTADSVKYFGEKPDNYDNIFTRPNGLPERLIQAFDDTKLDWAGFHKGVYTYPNRDHHYLTPSEQRQEPGWRERYLNWNLPFPNSEPSNRGVPSTTRIN